MADLGDSSEHVAVMGDGELTEFEYDRMVTVPSTAVIEAIAAVEDTDSIGLSGEYGITLYEHVDTDALDRLVSTERTTDIEVTIGVDDYTVWVNPDRVLVAHTDRESDEPGETLSEGVS
jgi:hypothetical protein